VNGYLVATRLQTCFAKNEQLCAFHKLTWCR